MCTIAHKREKLSDWILKNVLNHCVYLKGSSESNAKITLLRWWAHKLWSVVFFSFLLFFFIPPKYQCLNAKLTKCSQTFVIHECICCYLFWVLLWFVNLKMSILFLPLELLYQDVCASALFVKCQVWKSNMFFDAYSIGALFCLEHFHLLCSIVLANAHFPFQNSYTEFFVRMNLSLHLGPCVSFQLYMNPKKGLWDIVIVLVMDCW